MRDLFNETKQKYLSTLIISSGTFLGFEAISYAIGIYQLRTSLFLSFYVYAFHIFWLTFLFDLHCKKRGVLANARINYTGFKMLWVALKDRFSHALNWNYLRHYQNYLVLPGLLYWAVVILTFLNPFNYVLKQALIFSGTFAMCVGYWYMKEHISRGLEHKKEWIKVLSLVKLFAGFLIYSAVLGVTIHYGYDSSFLSLAVFTLTFLLIYQALFQHHLLTFETTIAVAIISFVMAMVALWVYMNWNTQYFTGGLVMLAVYNALWGMLHHYLDESLDRKVVFEYVAMMIFVISFLFASHNFNQRIT